MLQQHLTHTTRCGFSRHPSRPAGLMASLTTWPTLARNVASQVNPKKCPCIPTDDSVLSNHHGLSSPNRNAGLLDLHKIPTAQSLLGVVPRYLSDYIQHVADSNLHHLWSSSSLQLVWLSTVGDCAFPVAESCLCNSLPPDVTSAPTLFFLEPSQNLRLLRIIS